MICKNKIQLSISLFPQLYGMYTIKLALAVVLAGGVSRTNESGDFI